MGDHFGEIVEKGLKVDPTSILEVHQSEAELVSFFLCAVAQNVHDPLELVKQKLSVHIIIKNIKNPVRQKWRLILAKHAHDIPKLISVHGSLALGASLHDGGVLVEIFSDVGYLRLTEPYLSVLAVDRRPYLLRLPIKFKVLISHLSFA